MLEVDNVTKTYGEDVHALRNVSLAMNQGEFLSLVGRSGAGKSTLLKLITGETHPSEGTVKFRGADVAAIPSGKLPYHRRNIGIVFQGFRLLEDRTVFENVAFAMEAVGKRSSEIEEIVPQALKLVGLGDKHGRFPKELSGGEKQRVAIARALVHDPYVILADEPTGNLDPVTSWEIVRLLARINEVAHTAVVLATHDRDIVNALKKRVVVLDNGEVTSDTAEGSYSL